ncbi:MAG: adenylate/guanylate cyclase domain-containing protein [Rhodospirillales bacterium]
MKKFFKLNPLTITLITIFLGFWAYLYGIPFLDIMELKTVDLRFTTRGALSPKPEVVMAVIDEKSLKAEGKWIWPRSKMVELVNKLSQNGAKVIGFDIAFLEPDDLRIVETINAIQQKSKTFNIQSRPLEDYLKDLKLQSDSDKQLAEAIKNSDSRVVLGYFFHMDAGGAGDDDPAAIQTHEKNIRGSRHQFARYTSAAAQYVPLIEAQMPESNINVISDAAKYAGYFNMFPDPDGVVRWIPAVFKFNQSLYAPLSLVSVSAYFNEPISVSMAEHGVTHVAVGNRSIPTDELGRVLINYRGPAKTFPHVSITDILHDNVPEGFLKNKIVLVGATAVGIFDLRVTPFGTVFPGLEIHANVVDSILQNDFLQKPAWSAIFDIAAMLTAGLLLGIFLPRCGVVPGALLSGALFGGYIVLCQYLFSLKGLILNLVYPLLVVLIIYVAITAYRYLSEAKQKRFIKDAFSTYLAPSVVSQLIQSPDKLVLGGEKRIITAFFSDVQEFTSISENLTPHELVELLNEFLTEMTDVILDHKGTVDKFEGDAIIAFFGAPNPLVNQAEVACRACVDMQKRLAQLRAKWATEQRPELKMRIGMCTGPAVVGNMGSKSRMDYTMMGNTVNTAARLEGVNKVYGTFTMVADTTFDKVGNGVVGREIDAIIVLGKTEPVKVYELVGYPEDIDELLRTTLENYAQGLKAYRQQDWNQAIIFFNQALEATPNDGPSQTLLARCNQYKLDPPAADWNGAFSMLTK